MDTTWTLPPPPSPPGLFEVEFRQAPLLHEALRVLVSADLSVAGRQLSLAVTNRNFQDADADFYTLSHPDRVFVVVRGTLPIVVDTCLAITLFDFHRVFVERTVRLNLIELEVATKSAVEEARTLCLKGETPTEIVCSLKEENARLAPEPISLIQVIVTDMGDWSTRKDSCRLSLQMNVPILNAIMNWNSSPVHITVTARKLKFAAGNRNLDLRTRTIRDGQEISPYTIINRKGYFPYELMFHFHPKDAISKAMALSTNHGIFHLTSDWRCCLEYPVEGLGSIYFRF